MSGNSILSVSGRPRGYASHWSDNYVLADRDPGEDIGPQEGIQTYNLGWSMSLNSSRAEVFCDSDRSYQYWSGNERTMMDYTGGDIKIGAALGLKIPKDAKGINVQVVDSARSNLWSEVIRTAVYIEYGPNEDSTNPSMEVAPIADYCYQKELDSEFISMDWRPIEIEEAFNLTSDPVSIGRFRATKESQKFFVHQIREYYSATSPKHGLSY
jgi:hypothetical protein